jgi:hypothetical protein
MSVSLTSTAKANIATYMTEVLLPDAAEGILREREGTASTVAGGIGLFSTIVGSLGALFTGPAFPAVIGSGLAIGSIATAILGAIAGVALSPSAARAQMDNHYWYMVKRRLYCGLPDAYSDNIWLRDRLAYAIENIVPFNGRDIKLRTQANKVVAQAIRSIEPQTLNIALDYVKTCWHAHEIGNHYRADVRDGKKCGHAQPSHSDGFG